MRTYKAYETNVELPLIGGSTGSTSPAAPTGETSYSALYGQIPKTTANRATYNLSTGKITVPGGVVANVTGNASTATKFASNQSITLTGDTTGTASSQAGWSIATTTKKLSQTNITSLSSFTDDNALIYAAQGGSNSVTDKPTGVDAFGVISLKTASG